MSSPSDNIGKVCLVLEKYYDNVERRLKVKSRPAVIIGCEHDDPARITDVDYEFLPLSKLDNATPDTTYDYKVTVELKSKLGIVGPGGYIRTHKIAWNHIKHMKLDPTLNNLKSIEPEIFNGILSLNEQWVSIRNVGSKALATPSE